MIKNTPETSPDHALLLDADVKVGATVATVNASKSEAEKKAAEMKKNMMEIQQLFKKEVRERRIHFYTFSRKNLTHIRTLNL